MTQDRIDGLEKSVGKLTDDVVKIDKQVSKIGTHVEYLRQSDVSKKKRLETIAMIVLGALITAFVAWLISGGMVPK